MNRDPISDMEFEAFRQLRKSPGFYQPWRPWVYVAGFLLVAGLAWFGFWLTLAVLFFAWCFGTPAKPAWPLMVAAVCDIVIWTMLL